MRTLAFLYSNFDGRISRAVFWWAGSLMLAGELLLTAVLARALGLGWRDFVYADRRALWINLVVVAFFFWPSLALCIKRLHDRDLPGWWAGLLHVLLFIVYIDQVAMRPMLRDPSVLLLSLVPITMLGLLGAWLVVEMCLLAGTRGENRFGSRPADAATAADRQDRGRMAMPVTRPGE